MTNIPDAGEPPGSGDAGERLGIASQPLLSLAVDHRDEECIVTLDGELDVSTAPKLHEVLAAVVSQEAPDPIILDLAALRFVDSTGLSLLVSTNKRMKDLDRILILENAQPIVRRLLEVTGLMAVFRLEG